MSNGYHTPVLLDKVLDFLLTRIDGVYVDGTIGGGGHAEAILQRLSPTGRLIGFDADEDAIRFTRKRLSLYGEKLVLIHDNVARLAPLLKAHGIHQMIDGLLLDLGVSSFQLDEPQKGFSFQTNAPLDMRMDRRQHLSAADLIAHSSEEELARILTQYGEERFARRIARKITQCKMRRPIQTTGTLASVVQEAVGQKYLQKSLARVFQALRIAVNNEMENLQTVLRDGLDLLRVGGRIVTISYHSLEDRIVKSFFRSEAAEHIPSGSKLIPNAERVPRLRILTKKPISPSVEEVKANRRARSARLRAAERL